MIPFRSTEEASASPESRPLTEGSPSYANGSVPRVIGTGPTFRVSPPFLAQTGKTIDSRQQNQIDAAQNACDYLLASEHVPTWKSLKVFRESVAKLEGSLNILHVLAQIQAGKTSGCTLDKDRLRGSLRKRLITVANACISLGRAQNDSDLVAQARALDSKTEIEEIGDILIDDYAQMLYQHAVDARDAAPIVAARYGFRKDASDPILAPLLAAILAYGAIVPSPRNCIICRAGVSAGIESEIQRLQAILKDELDDLIVEFEREHTDFVRDYHKTRKISL